MNIEFDPVKSEGNLQRRGFDFAFASRIFLGRTVEAEDGRHDYGELRIKAVGVTDGITLGCVDEFGAATLLTIPLMVQV